MKRRTLLLSVCGLSLVGGCQSVATTSTVSFVGPDNVVRTVTARNPQVQSFIRGLRVGQQVDIVYEEALAISVEPMQ